MRFKELESLTDLPLEEVRQQFRNEEVIAVLPARGDVAGREALLVATPIKLAILIGDAGPTGYHWLTHWAPWDAVRLVDEDEMDPEPDEDGTYRLAVHVDGLTFHARLPGSAGRRALADFVVAVRNRREALALSS
jgi:hypothetical protein